MFICQFFSVDNGGEFDLVFDEVRIYILFNDKVEGVVLIDFFIRVIVVGELVWGYDGVFVIRLVFWRNLLV